MVKVVIIWLVEDFAKLIRNIKMINFMYLMMRRFINKLR